MKLILLVGPPGSGKSTWAKDRISNDGDLGVETTYINQDSQGKTEHLAKFVAALSFKNNIIVDRMNFNKEQRNRYLVEAKLRGYETEIHVLHESYSTCMLRCADRKFHETVKDAETAAKVLDFFFKNYERVEDNEADKVIRHYPTNHKSRAIICDLDGTLCNIDHRKHWVTGQIKNWPMFFSGIKDDKVNTWCRDIVNRMREDELSLVLCSGRSSEYRTPTSDWLVNNGVLYDQLLMRQSGDFRQDSIVKEILLDFEILTRYEPFLIIDDRKQVVDMWRRRGYICLQCAEGDF